MDPFRRHVHNYVLIYLLLPSHNLVFNQDPMTPRLWIVIFLIRGLDAGSPSPGGVPGGGHLVHPVTPEPGVTTTPTANTTTTTTTYTK